MRRLFISSVTAMAIVLGGCTTAQLTDFLGKVQAAAAVACKFVPTIDTVLNITAALGLPTAPVGGAVDAVAHAICSQVPPPASAAFARLPLRGVGPAVSVGKVGGIPVNGWRTP